MMDRHECVYFVATVDRSMIKIGFSYKPVDRMIELMRWSPLPLELLTAVPGRRQDERALHRRYISTHSHKEWFHATPKMLAEIEAIAHLGRLPSGFMGADDEPNVLLDANGTRAKLKQIRANHRLRMLAGPTIGAA